MLNLDMTQSGGIMRLYNEGRQEGHQEGEATLLTRLLQRRFGELPRWASEKLAKADPPTIEEWGVRILDAPTLDSVFADKS